MRFEVACEIEAPVDDVWAWWTDFGEPGPAFTMKHGLGSSRRRILSRDATRVVMEDASVLGTIHRDVEIRPDRTLHEIGSGSQRFESTWRFEAIAPARTRVHRTMRVRAARVFGPFSRWLTRHDLAYHCREAQRASRSAHGAVEERP